MRQATSARWLQRSGAVGKLKRVFVAWDLDERPTHLEALREVWRRLAEPHTCVSHKKPVA